MSQPTYDPSSKWMFEERGAAMLYVAGARTVISCTARKAEVVQPRQLPDGLLDVQFADAKVPKLMLVEVATYPEPRVVEQICDDLRLVRQARGVLVDAVVLCLCPKGTYRVPESAQETSPLGWSGETLRWKVVELWTIPAEEMLTAPDVGGAVLATLGQYAGPPEVLLQRCRNRIEREGGKQRDNLLAVAQVFAKLHYDKPKWLDILGGRNMIVETPFIQELMQESKCSGQVELIVGILHGKFGSVGPTIEAGLALIKEGEKLLRLARHAFVCPSLPSFEAALLEELPKPTPPSTRGKRKKKAE